MTKFHADDYVQFLKMITPQNMHDNIKQLQRFNVGEDCPVFDGLYDFCQLSAGGSIGGAVKLNMGKADVAVNWAGGLHHAKKCEARFVADTFCRFPASVPPRPHDMLALAPAAVAIASTAPRAVFPALGVADTHMRGWDAQRLLLRQRHRASHLGAAQGAPARPVRGH